MKKTWIAGILTAALLAVAPVYAENQETAAPATENLETTAPAGENQETAAAAAENQETSASPEGETTAEGAEAASENKMVSFFVLPEEEATGVLVRESEFIRYEIPKKWVIERGDPAYSIYGTEEYGSNALRVETHTPEAEFHTATEFLDDCEKKYLEDLGFTIQRQQKAYLMNGYMARRLYAKYTYANGTEVNADILMLADEEVCTIFTFLYPENEILMYYRDLEGIYASVRSLKEETAETAPETEELGTADPAESAAAADTPETAETVPAAAIPGVTEAVTSPAAP